MEGRDVKLLQSATAALIGIVVGGAGIASAATVQPTGDVPAGHALAQRWCAVCHQVEAGARQMPDVPPAFEAVAAMKSTTETSLKVWLQTSHPNMPNLRLSQDEMNDVVAYILSLKKS